MTPQVEAIFVRIRTAERELEREFAAQQERWHFRIQQNRVQFGREVRQAHARLRQGIAAFLLKSNLLSLITAPVIYSLIVPLVLVDVWISLYQRVCFPVYGIPRVPRRRFFAIDRHRLAYLNGIEKTNCVYCGYANGLFAYVREVAARTEQYWCPIRHARPVAAPHRRYQLFVDFGDAEGYHRQLPVLRQSYYGENEEQLRPIPAGPTGDAPDFRKDGPPEAAGRAAR